MVEYITNKLLQASNSVTILELTVMVSIIRLLNLEQNSSHLSSIISKFEGTTDAIIKVKLAMLIYILMSSGNKLAQAQVDFLKRILFINTFHPALLAKNEGIPLLQAVFQNSSEVYDAYINVISDSQYFFTKSEEEQKTALIWLYEIFMALFSYDGYSLRLYVKLVVLYQEALNRKLTEIALKIYYLCANLKLAASTTQEELKEANDDLSLPFSRYLQDHLIKEYGIFPNNRLVDKTKIKIGFVIDYMQIHAPFKVLYSLLKGVGQINTGSYEYYVYEIAKEGGAVNTTCKEMLENLGVHYTSGNELIDDFAKGNYASHLTKCIKLREKIIRDEIDVLICENTRVEFDFLLTTRTAPIQVYYSYGNYVYGVEGIDYRIGLGLTDGISLMEVNDQTFINCKQSLLEEFLIKPLSPTDISMIKEIRGKLPTETFILGSVGRLIKINNEEYLNVVLRLLKKYPNAVYIAAGDGNIEDIKYVINNLNREINVENIEERLFFPGQVDMFLYRNIIDLFLNTFPLPGGISLSEFAMAHKPIVSRFVPEYPENNNYVPGQFITHTIEEYIKLASQVIEDYKFRQEMSVTCYEFTKNSLNVTKCARDFLDLLEYLLDKPNHEQIKKKYVS